MDVIINKVVAVLQVLAFGDAVRGNQHLDALLDVRQQLVRLFRDGREEGEDVVEVGP